MSEFSQKKRTPGSGAGFTLLELIAVMGIIVAMALVVVGSYSGIMRSIAASAGANSLRKAASLCHQHACIDGARTYFWVTGVDTYVLCRKAGTITDVSTSDRSGEERPDYLPEGQYSAKWLIDAYSDLGASQESFAASVGADAEDALADSMKLGEYDGALIFDMETGELAKLTYPPWYDALSDKWVMGIAKGTSAFDKGATYGWALYPEQELPEGYVFKDDMYDLDGSGDFVDGVSFYFEPDGSADSDDNAMTLTVVEVGTGRESSIKISKNGKIE